MDLSQSHVRVIGSTGLPGMTRTFFGIDFFKSFIFLQVLPFNTLFVLKLSFVILFNLFSVFLLH